MGLIEVSERTSPQRAAEIKARLYGNPAPVWKPRVVFTPPVRPRQWLADHDAHAREYRREKARGAFYDALYGEVSEKPQPVAFAKAACVVFGIDWFDLRGGARMRALVLPRHKIVWLLRKLYPVRVSYPIAARVVGMENHTSAIHAVRKIDALIASNDPSVADLKGWVSE